MTIGITFNGTDMIIGANGFSTENRYVRQVADPLDAVMTMVEGPSIAINTGVSGSNGYFAWRFECGALTMAGGSNGVVTAPAAGFAVDRVIAL